MHFILRIALNDSNLKTCKNLYILSDIAKWVNAPQGLEHQKIVKYAPVERTVYMYNFTKLHEKVDFQLLNHMLGKQTVCVTNKAKWAMF